MFHIKVQNECGMCVCVRVCVSVGVCAISSPFRELSTLHGNSTWSFRPLPAPPPPLSFMRYLCIFPNLDFLVRQQRCLSNTDLTLALTSTATSAATAALLSSFAYITRHTRGQCDHTSNANNVVFCSRSCCFFFFRCCCLGMSRGFYRLVNYKSILTRLVIDCLEWLISHFGQAPQAGAH